MIDWKKHITSDPDILAGKPIFVGTRLSVAFIMERLATGWSQEDILENYPRLNEEMLAAMYAYTCDLIQDSLFYDIPLKAA